MILIWIPSHVGINKNFGNELVDTLAKKGTEMQDKIKLPYANNVFYNGVKMSMRKDGLQEKIADKLK